MTRWSNAKHENLSAAYLPLLYPPGPDGMDAGELSEPALRRAASSVAAVAAGHSGVAAEPPRATNMRLYSEVNPLGATEFPAPYDESVVQQTALLQIPD